MSSKAKSNVPDRFALTDDEKEILQLHADGMSVDEIAEEMEVSKATITNMKRMIFFKQGAKNVTHAVALAFREGDIS